MVRVVWLDTSPRSRPRASRPSGGVSGWYSAIPRGPLGCILYILYRTSEKLHEIFAGLLDRTRAARMRRLKACVQGLSFSSSSCETGTMESLAKRSKQDFVLSRTVPKGFIRSYRFSPGNYIVDVPSLFQEIFQLLISLMTTQLGHMQFKVSVSVQVKRKCVIDNPILA